MTGSDGYVTDIAYTAGHYPELAPSFLHYAATLQGEIAPDPASPYSYCELGCGQGFGTNILAAANPHAEFVGIDFHAGQIANARDLAHEADLKNVTFRCESFQEGLARPDGTYPEFDFITLHGIYAWVTPANRRAIVDFIERTLRPGGLVFVTYNCMPGWTHMAPFQRLLFEHARHHPGRSDRQTEAGFAFAGRAREAGFRYFAANPGVGPFMDKMKDKKPEYLAHEYLNAAWEPLYFTDVARDMAEAQLDYVGSAAPLQNFDTLTLPADAQKVISEESDPVFRELLKDYAVNREFRWDIFVRGSRPMTNSQKQTALMDLPFVTLLPRSEISTTFTTPRGEATGEDEIYKPLLDHLERGPTTVRTVAEATGIRPSKLIEAISALASNLQVHPRLTSPPETAPAKRLNRVIHKRILQGERYRHQAAPAIGNGITGQGVENAALNALSLGEGETTDKLAEAILKRFKAGSWAVVKEGKPLENEADMRKELRTRAADILGKRVPIWRQLGMI